MPTADEVFRWACRYSGRNADRGAIHCLPTLAQAAKRFRCRIADVEAAISEYDGDGYLGIAVGMQSGNGVADFGRPGAYRIEAEPAVSNVSHT